VFPAATKDKIYVGKQAQFNAYKKALQAQGSRRIVTVEQPPPRTKPVQPVELQKNDNDQRTVEVPPPPPPKQHREVKTDCMLVATENYHRLQTVAVWARILAFKFQINGTVIKEGHAVAVWQIDEGGKVYAIDSRGTLELDTTSQKESDVLSALGMKYSEGSGYSFVLVGHFAE
jgi:hypothetical protein